jgi:hypothetical protein
MYRTAAAAKKTETKAILKKSTNRAMFFTLLA